MCDRFQKLKEENWINQGNFALLQGMECSLGGMMDPSPLLKTKKNYISKGVWLQPSLSMKLTNLFVESLMIQIMFN